MTFSRLLPRLKEGSQQGPGTRAASKTVERGKRTRSVTEREPSSAGIATAHRSRHTPATTANAAVSSSKSVPSRERAFSFFARCGRRPRGYHRRGSARAQFRAQLDGHDQTPLTTGHSSAAMRRFSSRYCCAAVFACVSSRSSSPRSRNRPAVTTARMRRTLAMSSSGFASSNTRSADRPGAIVPSVDSRPR